MFSLRTVGTDRARSGAAVKSISFSRERARGAVPPPER